MIITALGQGTQCRELSGGVFVDSRFFCIAGFIVCSGADFRGSWWWFGFFVRPIAGLFVGCAAILIGRGGIAYRFGQRDGGKPLPPRVMTAAFRAGLAMSVFFDPKHIRTIVQACRTIGLNCRSLLECFHAAALSPTH